MKFKAGDKVVYRIKRSFLICEVLEARKIGSWLFFWRKKKPFYLLKVLKFRGKPVKAVYQVVASEDRLQLYQDPPTGENVLPFER